MEHDSAKLMDDLNAGSDRTDLSKPVKPEMVLVGNQQQQYFIAQSNRVDGIGCRSVTQGLAPPADKDVSGEVNMEASISADDVMRAGGFGARDDISSFLPIASDSTDFEASLRDARDYEEPQECICRPGLGWKDVKKM